MKKCLLLLLLLAVYQQCFCWGFFAHRRINYYAVFLLPPKMMALYKPNIEFLSAHAVDPDKRRYAIPEEAARHFIDIDHYGTFPYNALPRKWEEAVSRYGADSIRANGMLPWWTQVMLQRLTRAFEAKDQSEILKLSAETGHYIADAHVPLHACRNHNGQLTGQKGIHAFWESRIPELMADKNWSFFIGKAGYIANPQQFIWERVLESAAASDSVLRIEKQLSNTFPPDKKFAFEPGDNRITRQYSAEYALTYNEKLNGMIERRMRQSVLAVASFWYTAWVNAGQPDLGHLSNNTFSADDLKAFDELDLHWKNRSADDDDEP